MDDSMTHAVGNSLGEMTSQNAATPTEAKPKQRRGFALLDAEKRRQFASLGGKASHTKGTGHEWDREAAREAGRKGGLASQKRRAGVASAPANDTVPEAHEGTVVKE